MGILPVCALIASNQFGNGKEHSNGLMVTKTSGKPNWSTASSISSDVPIANKLERKVW